MSKDRRLGRGLAALLGTPLEEVGGGANRPPEDTAAPAANQPSVGAPAAEGGGESSAAGLLQLNVYEIEDNPFQPRRDFSEAEIASLSESLKEHDMLQPILVRKVGGRYQLISGERRLRAAIQAGWSTVPARLREADDRLVAELAIVENLQRKDLNPVEKALSFKRYLDEHGCSQEDLARRLKIDRSTIANLMRLLELPAPVLDSLRSGTLSAGHARALLPLGDEDRQLELSARIQAEGLSVRAVESLVQEIIEEEDGVSILPMTGELSAAKPKQKPRTEQVAALEQELRIALGLKVEIRQSARGRGKLVVHFRNHEEFEQVRGLLTDGGSSQAAQRRAG